MTPTLARALGQLFDAGCVLTCRRIGQAVEVAYNGPGTEGAFGAVTVGLRTGRPIRATLHRGNSDTPGALALGARQVGYLCRDAATWQRLSG